MKRRFLVPILAGAIGLANIEASTQVMAQSSLQPTTANILSSIAEIEVERALNSTRFNPQHPMIRQFDAQLQDLYKQLESAQPQVDKELVQNVISDAAYEKIDALQIQKSQLTTKYSPKHPELVSIDSQIKQLEALISHHII